MDNAEIAQHLEEIADLLEIDGANPFRIRAYRNAVRTIESQTRSLCQQLADGADLTELQGIGKQVASHVGELCDTGRMSQLEELKERVPPGLTAMMRLPGVGPKKARKLWDELGVTSIDELEKAAEEEKVRALDGFGVKSEQKILTGIEDFRHHVARVRLDEADRHVGPLVEYLAETEGAGSVEVAGSYRRRKETVGDLDVLAIADDEAVAEALMERFVAYTQVSKVLMRGTTRTSVQLRSGLQVDLRVLASDSHGAAMVYFTGSKEHNVRLRQRGVERGLRISEYGVFEVEEGDAEAGAESPDAEERDPRRGKRVAGATEEEVYAAVDLPWIPPELREDRGEIAAAARGELPRLITAEDLKGDLQMHSTWSDGKASVEEMLEACAAKGYEYFALTDHSKALAMTGGLDAAKLREQWKEIDQVQARHPEIRLLKSLEVDILADGSLDLEDEMLEQLDLVLVSVHSRFELPAAEQTARILAAVRHPEVNVLAHPTGRRLGFRKPMDFDVEAVLEACLEHNVAVELNAHPERLDLKDTHLVRARELGLPITISTDAHEPRGLDLVSYGIEQARRAWLEPKHVWNALGLDDFLAAIGHREAKS